MPMFYGENQHTIDPKGRITMPSKFKINYGDSFMMTPGSEQCLFVYAMEEWSKLEASMDGVNSSEEDARDLARHFFAKAEPIDVDRQGRVLIPQNLREAAQLDKDVYIIGVRNRIEIWDKIKYEEYKKKFTYEIIAAKLQSNNIRV
jgi:MraZ protein